MSATEECRMNIQRRRLARAQLAVFDKTSTAGLLLVPGILVLIAIAFSMWFDTAIVIVWAGTAIAVQAAMTMVARWCARRSLEDAAFDRWRTTLVAMNCVYQVIWASVALLFWVPGEGAWTNTLILLMLAGSMAPAVAWSSVYLPLLYGAILIPGAFLAFRIVSIDTGHDVAMFLSTLLFLALLIVLGRHLNAAITELLQLRDEKDALITRLKTEKTVAEEERARAQEASQSKSAFLAGVSHELRTPLNAIIGFSDVMRTETFGQLGHDNYKQYAGDIHSSGRHLLSLIDDILDLARIEAGRFELDEEPVDLAAACEECARMFEISAGNRHIAIRTDVPRRLPRIVADERAVRQMWLNLASNALKFTDSDGTVTLFARQVANGAIEFGVRDTGCGMDAEELARVMEAFTQGRSRARTGERGTGLGLAIVNGLAQAHGGHVELDSRVGEGTTASIVLPRARVIAAELERRETA